MTTEKTLPRIVIDARMVGPQGHGIARYVTLLAKGLKAVKDAKELPYSPEFLVLKGQEKVDPSLDAFPVHKIRSRFLSPWEIFDIPRALKRARADLYHSPSFSSLWRAPCKFVVTIHDLNHLYYGNFFQNVYYRVLLRRFARLSETVLTVSEFSRKELAGWLNQPLNSIDVAPNAIDPEFIKKPAEAVSNRILKELGLNSRKFFFSLINPKPHKNLELLITAHGIYRQNCKTAGQECWPLVITCPFPIDKLKHETDIISLDSKSHLNIGLNATTIKVLLSQAAAVYFPSLYEGFGLPPVEAICSGTPLVTSLIPPVQEGLSAISTGASVTWIDPRDLSGWAQSFRRVQEGRVNEPTEKMAKDLLTEYSVLKLGQKMDQVYRRVLKISDDEKEI